MQDLIKYQICLKIYHSFGRIHEADDGDDEDDEERKWISTSTIFGITVPSGEAIVKVRTVKKRSLSALRKWLYRLLVRNRLTFIAETHFDKGHPEN